MKNGWFAAACLCMLLLGGCRKDDDDMLPIRKPAEAVTARSGCIPHETIDGVIEVTEELTLFTACQLDTPCEGAEQYSKFLHQLTDLDGKIFVYTNPGESFTPAEQQELLDAAMRWAWLNRPAGYSIVKITFRWMLFTSGGSRWYIGLEVTYRKCTGDKCTPFESLSGRAALLADLTRYFSGACNSSAPACQGSYVTTTLSDLLKDPWGVPYTFNDAQIVNVAMQNQVKSAASARAAAMTPAGYTLYDIDVAPGPNGQIVVTGKYMKCVGGGNT